MSLMPVVGRMMMRSLVDFYRQHLQMVRENPGVWTARTLRSGGYLSLAAVRWLACIDKYHRLAQDPLFAGKLCAVKFESLASNLQRMDLLKALANFVWTDFEMSERGYEEVVKRYSDATKPGDLAKTAIRSSDVLWQVVESAVLAKATFPVHPVQLANTL